MSRTKQEQSAAMGRIQTTMSGGGMGQACNLLIRRNDKWLQVRGNVGPGGKFKAQYSNVIDVPKRLDAHCTSETAMKLLAAWVIEESRAPAPAPGVSTPVQRIDLGGDTAMLVVCNSEGQPARQGNVSDWPTHADIVEESVIEENRQ